MLRNTSERFGWVAAVLHWLTAALIITQFVLAELAENAGEARAGNPAMILEQLALLARHKSVGLTIFALAVIRIGWRLTTPAPPYPIHMRPWERHTARITHYLMYAIILVMPITGWLMSSATNFPVSWFGVFTLPDLVAPDEGTAETFKSIHHALATCLLVVVLLHVAAALKHHVFDRDDVLRRMLPWTRLKRA